MLDPKIFDDFIQKCTTVLPQGLQTLQEDMQKNLKASWEAGLARLDLVTREEFELQTAVLTRTREKLTQLEDKVNQLEQRLVATETDKIDPTADMLRK